jgi:polysulfide reductase chain C
MATERQSIWGWQVAAYLFVAGVGAGGYLGGVVADFLDYEKAAKIGAVVGPVLIAIATIFLLLDLGRPVRFWRAMWRPNSSWIARGVYILTITFVLGAVHALLWIWPGDQLVGSEAARRSLGVVTAVLSVSVMAYTGFLLGAVRPIPLWRTSILPLLFVLSGTSAGIMAISGLATIWELHDGQAQLLAGLALMIRVDSPVLIVELAVLLTYLALVGSSVTGGSSIRALVRGDLAKWFWVGVLGIGMVMPLLLEWFLGVATDRGRAAEAMLVFVAVVGGLLGSFLLRFVVVAGGAKKPLMIRGQEVSLPSGPRLRPSTPDPKTVGRMQQGFG